MGSICTLSNRYSRYIEISQTLTVVEWKGMLFYMGFQCDIFNAVSKPLRCIVRGNGAICHCQQWSYCLWKLPPNQSSLTSFESKPTPMDATLQFADRGGRGATKLQRLRRDTNRQHPLLISSPLIRKLLKFICKIENPQEGPMKSEPERRFVDDYPEPEYESCCETSNTWYPRTNFRNRDAAV